MRNQFEALIREFCQLVGLPDAQSVADGEPISVDGVAFSVIFDEGASNDRFFLYGDFGVPPAQAQAEVLHELLKHNFMHFTGKGPSFTVSPFTGHVVYVETLNLDRDKATDLANAMASLSALAQDWGRTYFLRGPNMLRFGEGASLAWLA